MDFHNAIKNLTIQLISTATGLIRLYLLHVLTSNQNPDF